MTAATALLLIKLFGPAALQLGGQAVGNIHQDVLGYQSVLLAQQVTQQEYYRATAAYWNAQRRCCCKTTHRHR